MEFITILEKTLGKQAKREMRPFQPGDVLATHADVTDLERDVDFRPQTSLEFGIGRFVEWYRAYYRV